MSSSWTFFVVKVDGNDVNRGICKEVFIYTDSWVDVHEDDIFVRQDILQFFSEESKDYKYLKSP